MRARRGARVPAQPITSDDVLAEYGLGGDEAMQDDSSEGEVAGRQRTAVEILEEERSRKRKLTQQERAVRTATAKEEKKRAKAADEKKRAIAAIADGKQLGGKQNILSFTQKSQKGRPQEQAAAEEASMNMMTDEGMLDSLFPTTQDTQDETVDASALFGSSAPVEDDGMGDLFGFGGAKDEPAAPAPLQTSQPKAAKAKTGLALLQDGAGPGSDEEGQYAGNEAAKAKRAVTQPGRKPSQAAKGSIGGGANYMVKQGGGDAANGSAVGSGNAPARFALPATQPQAPPQGQRPTQPGAPAHRMYWLDAREDGFGLLGTGGNSSPGTVYVFGKMVSPDHGGLVSCCLRVNGLPRQVFFLPRKTVVDRVTGKERALETKMNPVTNEVIPYEAMKEINALCAAKGITERRLIAKQRWYAFEEEGVPRDCETYLKLSYPAKYGALNVTPESAADVARQTKTVSHAFGDGRSFLEMFLLKKKLKGPGWLDFSPGAGAPGGVRRVPPQEQLTHCAVEFVIDSYKTVRLCDEWERIPPPPLKAVALALHTELAKGTNEVIAASAAFYPDIDVDRPTPTRPPVRWAGIRPLPNTRLPVPHVVDQVFQQHQTPMVMKFDHEAPLLEQLMTVLQNEDPDIIVGHNFLSFDLDVLLHRMARLNVRNWDRMGRMKLRNMPKLQQGAGGGGDSTWEERSILAGRCVADSYLLAKEYCKAANYRLRNLALEQRLGNVTVQNVDLRPLDDLAGALQHPQGVLEIVTRTDDKAFLAFLLVEKLQAVQLTKRLTYLAGNLWARTLTGSRAERTEYLLLHDFYRQKYILPDKRRISYGKRARDDDAGDAGGKAGGLGIQGKRKAKYAGGMVLEPKKGLYTDFVLLLDFNSLYPSIIQEYQVCFSTVDRPKDDTVPPPPKPYALRCSVCGEAEDVCRHKSILPKAIRSLVDARRQVKGMIKTEKNPDLLARYDIIQKALKLTANSIYGCLGFEHSRFYAQPLAQLVTQQGREALASTVDLVETLPEHNLSVVYGDTDSVMLNTGIPNNQPIALATQKAQFVKQAVNRRYSNLEIDIDGVFKSILLVRKKKYAAVVVKDWDREGRVYEKEIKGLDMVRRDWCPYTSEAQEKVLDYCLSGEDEETVRESIIAYLNDTAAVVRSNECELEKFLITKSLTKEPQGYADAHAQPHVVVALRMQRNSIPVKVGDFIQYVICTAESSQAEDPKKLSSRAFTKDEVLSKQMTIDKEWYLAQQFHPPISRLTEHITGLDSFVVAHALDIETSGLQHPQAQQAPEEEYLITACGRAPVAERFFPIELHVKCSHCKAIYALNPHEIILHTLKNWDPAKHRPGMGLLRHEACGKLVDLKAAGNTIIREIRKRQREYFNAAPAGYESNFLAELTDTSGRSDRHTRDYIDCARTLFSLKEWCQVVFHWALSAKDEEVAKVVGENRTNVHRVAMEKIYNLMSETERDHFLQISVYLKSVTEKFARSHVDVGDLFHVLAPSAAA
eukprot:TRINITY_DN19429_c0_g2_i1.p1 TRINITY_DN19429_c0_g2~~TRINITY_DN19429_c0_g2_i1.p1  ORF type:complete len:1489 (+),score=630.89 TRINITY_DN19429_c0_g2_i1:76-4542(+)